MAGKGFLVRVRLDLHAVRTESRRKFDGNSMEIRWKFDELFQITCPGVWLCPSGKVALRITSLGSTLESHRVSPIFPLLFHNEFHFEKTFTRLAALTELQQHFEREIVRAELIQWLGPCNRVVVLATFETDLADLLYPVSRCKRLPPGVDVDLLMDPMKPFPVSTNERVSTISLWSLLFFLFALSSLLSLLPLGLSRLVPFFSVFLRFSPFFSVFLRFVSSACFSPLSIRFPPLIDRTVYRYGGDDTLGYYSAQDRNLDENRDRGSSRLLVGRDSQRRFENDRPRAYAARSEKRTRENRHQTKKSLP
nr:uncharacterized protein LOC116424627 isoform X2 [Nomia melanderi]